MCISEDTPTSTVLVYQILQICQKGGFWSQDMLIKRSYWKILVSGLLAGTLILSFYGYAKGFLYDVLSF